MAEGQGSNISLERALFPTLILRPSTISPARAVVQWHAHGPVRARAREAGRSRQLACCMLSATCCCCHANICPLGFPPLPADSFTCSYWRFQSCFFACPTVQHLSRAAGAETKDFAVDGESPGWSNHRPELLSDAQLA